MTSIDWAQQDQKMKPFVEPNVRSDQREPYSSINWIWREITLTVDLINVVCFNYLLGRLLPSTMKIYTGPFRFW